MKYITLLLSLALISCNPSPDASEPPVMAPVLHTYPVIQTQPPVDYGHNLWYFPNTDQYFGLSLTKFLADNKDTLEVTAMTGNGRGGYGTDIGYFVTFKKK